MYQIYQRPVTSPLRLQMEQRKLQETPTQGMPAISTLATQPLLKMDGKNRMYYAVEHIEHAPLSSVRQAVAFYRKWSGQWPAVIVLCAMLYLNYGRYAEYYSPCKGVVIPLLFEGRTGYDIIVRSSSWEI